MNKQDATNLLKTKLNEFGLIENGWSYGFDNARRRCGLCAWREKRISLSIYYTALNRDELILDTVLHEIAHALVGAGHGHDRTWKRKCQEIGARPQRCKTDAEIIERPYRATCPECGKTHTAFKRTRIACRNCCVKHAGGKFDTRFLFTWVKNEGVKP